MLRSILQNPTEKSLQESRCLSVQFQMLSANLKFAKDKKKKSLFILTGFSNSPLFTCENRQYCNNDSISICKCVILPF